MSGYEQAPNNQNPQEPSEKTVRTFLERPSYKSADVGSLSIEDKVSLASGINGNIELLKEEIMDNESYLDTLSGAKSVAWKAKIEAKKKKLEELKREAAGLGGVKYNS
jgi:hypothetical protein